MIIQCCLRVVKDLLLARGSVAEQWLLLVFLGYDSVSHEGRGIVMLRDMWLPCVYRSLLGTRVSESILNHRRSRSLIRCDIFGIFQGLWEVAGACGRE